MSSSKKAAFTAPAPNDGRADIARRVKELAPWFHNLDLRGVATAPQHFLGDFPRSKWTRFAHVIAPDLRGKTVLDVGCNAGFYAFQMKQRGAERVVGIDESPAYLEQARFAARVYGLDVEFIRMNAYDVSQLREKFDLVIFMGVFYHLRHPLLALDLLHEHVVKDQLLFQSLLRGSGELTSVPEDAPFEEESIFDAAGYPKMHFVEHSYASDPTNWWIPNRACAEAMLRSAGFHIWRSPEPDVYLCRTDRNVKPWTPAPLQGSSLSRQGERA